MVEVTFLSQEVTNISDHGVSHLEIRSFQMKERRCVKPWRMEHYETNGHLLREIENWQRGSKLS